MVKRVTVVLKCHARKNSYASNKIEQRFAVELLRKIAGAIDFLPLSRSLQIKNLQIFI